MTLLTRLRVAEVGTIDERPRAHSSDGGEVRFMVRSGDYVMVRRPKCAPFVWTVNEWLARPLYDAETVASYRAAIIAAKEGASS